MYNNFKYLEQEEERLEKEAKDELLQIKALKILLKSDLLAAEIHIGGMKFGVCNISKLLPAIEHHENELKKFLNDEENEWY